MKKFIPIILFVLLFSGFGCQKTQSVKVPFGWTNFESVDYNFSLAYPDSMELKERPLDQQDSTYAGLQGKFFLSLRDVEREESSTTLALFYAMKDVDYKKFEDSLVASDPESITIKESTDINQGGIPMKKVVSTTALGEDKIHYLFTSGENLIVISVVLREEETFGPVFETMQVTE
ncbi:MAG: hypothetical protein UX09_C0048G0003 [Candidatus Uhrbacteria bacterium GW2011_GWE2_45_35]|uniref:Lipoprotein n=2 Tax=Candidatus Uhriibacteriota TaxID=1752732 RepID=A0A0G1JE03_9BACT|nr:MAG: hypothetical protein UW63_C0043G0006 [Candidatus Uhrbacteria bacterium GW2011_GWF2_44_350]KKU06562.1 MAG: hypothetical protein UX09_C0048G0003 [Candidatus Uhrbacteria bacterium GW2011_GWE2_45_35]HBR80090.1 hypothetical protein [Candidatus Uhrbacteria bacterium]HCU32210.1 hypothetical protein [Candidatus Uhrbacteria bacterium]